jgi:cytochrome P450
MTPGSDTTAITLSAMLYYMLKNRGAFNKLRHEIDEYHRQGRLSKVVQFKESLEIPYFQAFVKKTLRMHPATRLPLERVVPKGGATICDQFSPEGMSPQILAAPSAI